MSYGEQQYDLYRVRSNPGSFGASKTQDRLIV
jgi:hypothetical protein